jgi:tetratricopeptide (TPR) repeat protein
MIRGLLLLWMTWQSLSPGAAQHMQAAENARKQGHLEVAISEWRKVSELEPTRPEVFLSLGQAYMENHDYSGAMAPLEKALELNPDLVAADQLLGYALLAQGFARESIAHLERAHEKAALGIAETETGQLPEAVRNLQAALAERPNDPDLLYYLGRASGLLSKQAIDTLLSGYPDSARAHQAMGENYLVLRQVPEAEHEYQQALQLRPETPNLHLELGVAYATVGQWDKAEQEFRAESKVRPGNAEAAYRLGDALMQQGNIKDARHEFARADRLEPEMPETLYALGKAASLDGDAVVAEKAWTKLLTLEKQSGLAAQAHFGLAGIYRKQGKTAKAEHEMEEFHKLQGTVPSPETTQK